MTTVEVITMTKERTINDVSVSEIYKKLCEPLPESARQKALLKDFRGYDADGYGYQWLVDMLNEVVGVFSWSSESEIIESFETTSSNGHSMHNVSIRVVVTLVCDDGTLTARENMGGHTSRLHYDALKGAHTNALKKALAMFGLGASAYRGTIDDDLQFAEVDNVKVLKGKDVSAKPVPYKEVKQKKNNTVESILNENDLTYEMQNIGGENSYIVTKGSYQKRNLLKSMGFSYDSRSKA